MAGKQASSTDTAISDKSILSSSQIRFHCLDTQSKTTANPCRLSAPNRACTSAKTTPSTTVNTEHGYSSTIVQSEQSCTRALVRKKLERKCVNFYQKGKVRLLSPYGVHAAAVGVDAVADALAADGEVGVFNTKVSKCPDLAIPGGHTERRSLPRQRYRRPLHGLSFHTPAVPPVPRERRDGFDCLRPWHL